MITTRIIPLLLVTGILSFTTFKHSSVKTLPTQIDFTESVPDTVRPFIKAIFQISGIDVVTPEKMKELSQPETRVVNARASNTRGNRGSRTDPTALGNRVIIDLRFTDATKNKFLFSYQVIPVPSNQSQTSSYKTYEVDPKIYENLEWPFSVKKAVETIIGSGNLK